jgi:hypothetical protein
MSPVAKLMTGLAAVLVLGWLNHGPLGKGVQFVDRLEVDSKAVIVSTDIEGVEIRMDRDPLKRAATLSGNADDFQRYGMRGQKGLTQLIGDVPGMGTVRWADEPDHGFALPLLVETLLLNALAYAIGVGAAWLLWGRKPREKFAL